MCSQLYANLIQATLIALCRTAWTESPSLALQLISRFPHPRLQKEIRWILLNFPEKAIFDPEAVQILLQGTIPPDVTHQLKVCSWYPICEERLLNFLVPTVLVECQSSQCRDVFPSSLSKPPFGAAICHARFGEPLRGCDIFLCAADCANITI